MGRNTLHWSQTQGQNYLTWSVPCRRITFCACLWCLYTIIFWQMLAYFCCNCHEVLTYVLNLWCFHMTFKLWVFLFFVSVKLGTPCGEILDPPQPRSMEDHTHWGIGGKGVAEGEENFHIPSIYGSIPRIFCYGWYLFFHVHNEW